MARYVDPRRVPAQAKKAETGRFRVGTAEPVVGVTVTVNTYLIHTGAHRMLDHLFLSVSDIERSIRFYRARPIGDHGAPRLRR